MRIVDVFICTYILNVCVLYTRRLLCGGGSGVCVRPKHETETGINWIAHYVKWNHIHIINYYIHTGSWMAEVGREKTRPKKW